MAKRYSIKAFSNVALLLFVSFYSHGQSQSVARRWNEAALTAIRGDFARPTVHARNLFHLSMAMYDAWAVYDETASTYFLNHTFRFFHCPYKGVPQPTNKKTAQEEAISYAAYRLLVHRFKDSPAANTSKWQFDLIMKSQGYDIYFTSTDYSTGRPAALGNYIAEQLIKLGYEDGSNEERNYRNEYYAPINSPLNPYNIGFANLSDPNRWQPLELANFIDQSGLSLAGPPPFLSPEWGKVMPFALKEADLKVYQRQGKKYWVYHDPGHPPLLKENGNENQLYLWNFTQVAKWSAGLAPESDELIDISPAANGNISHFPSTFEEIKEFYKKAESGNHGHGYELNPYTGEPYMPQIVPKGDYTRVLAEYWADGPDSETPPGHWFSILNYVSSHKLFERKFKGEGEELDALEWDIKAYFALGGALHDAAITAWGIKGYYDYVRPISAIRYMAEKGQSSDPSLPNYHPEGLPLEEGAVELVKEGDPLAGFENVNVNKVKIYAWKGHEYVYQNNGVAGAGWVLAERWMPYQRPNFVSPPFAGYISGHSTFSRTAAEVLSLLTGSEYFPGGMSEFKIFKNNYLVFEKGPSVDIILQWAKYKDAADQCSLSRIWGGIHPPADDLPGRIIGQKLGTESFNLAAQYFEGKVLPEEEPEVFRELLVYPNPLPSSSQLKIHARPLVKEGVVQVINLLGQVIHTEELRNNMEEILELNLPQPAAGVYIVRILGKEVKMAQKLITVNSDQ